MLTAPLLLGLCTVHTLGTSCTRAQADPAAVERARSAPPAETLAGSDVPDDRGLATAVFAGGCFWCTESVFEAVDGVADVVSGYAGGSPKDATYPLVASGATDHAEVVKVRYDPEKVGFGDLLRVFMTIAHDPTQLDRQGPDRGRQYRSAVFYLSDAQKQAAQRYIQTLDAAGLYPKPIVTRLEPLTQFHAAEDDHQDFVRLNPGNRYVVVNALPKVEKLKLAFPGLVDGQ